MYACIHVEVWEASTFPHTLRPFSANYIMGNSRTNFAIRNLLIIFTRLADCNKRYFYNICSIGWDNCDTVVKQDESSFEEFYLTLVALVHCGRTARKEDGRQSQQRGAWLKRSSHPCSFFTISTSLKIPPQDRNIPGRPSITGLTQENTGFTGLNSQQKLPPTSQGLLRPHFYWRSKKCCQMLAKTIS